MKISDTPMISARIYLSSLLIALLFITTGALAGNFEVVLSAGKGTYALSDLRSFQQNSLPDLGVGVESVTTFPPYYFYQLSGCYYINGKWGIGATGAFFSTGARNHYEDYSGYYKLDLLVNAQNAGLLFNRKFSIGKGLSFIPEIASGIKMSNLSLDEELKVYPDSVGTSMQVVSIGFWAEPRIRMLYQPLPFMGIGFSAGYELNLPSKNSLRENRNQFLMGSDNRNVKLGWSGVRASLNLSIIF